MIYFQNSFNCHGLELLRTATLPIHKVIKRMNGVLRPVDNSGHFGRTYV